MQRQLWFAWKIVLLQYRKQRCGLSRQTPRGCDLLEKSYFCSIANNIWWVRTCCSSVVICLKNRTFAVSQTTSSVMCSVRRRLWFAWKIVLLQYRKQQSMPRVLAASVVICLKNRTFAVSQTTVYNFLYFGICCDLLEKSYFCSIANNHFATLRFLRSVVICLKNRTFAVSQTTFGGFENPDNSCDLLEKSYFCSIANNQIQQRCRTFQLWFAWKIVLLQYRKQPNLLLSYCIAVVICLKNRTFAVSQTTLSFGTSDTTGLWFAWKIVLLQYRKQHTFTKSLHKIRCDLLEKSYFCSIANNISLRKCTIRLVVICLKNRTFAVSQTTTF